MAARLSSAGEASKMATPPTITKIVAKKADFIVSILPIRHLRDEVLEDLPALSRNQWLAHSHSSNRVADSSSTKAVSFSSRVRNKTLPIVAMRVSNPDRSPVGING